MPFTRTIPQAHCVVLERFGKFSRVLHAGVHLRRPFETIRPVGEFWGKHANKQGYLIELTEQHIDTKSRHCHTKDNVPVDADACVYWRIFDPAKAIYEVDILPEAILDMAIHALRSHIGSLDLDTLLSDRLGLSERISGELSANCRKWGVEFHRVEIRELTTSDDVSEAMVQEMDAERKRRAAVAAGRGQAEAEVAKAEADKKALVLRAQGEAEALALIANAELNYVKKLTEYVTTADATRLLLAQKYIDAIGTISKNPANKIFLPSSFGGTQLADQILDSQVRHEIVQEPHTIKSTPKPEGL